MTYEEFLAWADEDTHAEWVDGEVILMSPAASIHQLLSKLLITTLELYVVKRTDGVIYHAPFQMKLSSRPAGREPDLLYVSGANRHRIQGTFLDGPADLVIEIVSPESGARDRGDKFYEYEAAGVGEYWILDPQRKQAEFHQLGVDLLYTQVMPEDGVYHSHVISGLWLKTEWLFRNPLPSSWEIVAEWGLI